MAEEALEDTLELTEVAEDENPELENQEQNEETGAESEEDEVEILFGDEAVTDEPETPLIKHLRAENRRIHKELAEVRKAAAPVQTIEVGERPTLAGCEYDEDAYDKALDDWKERKRKAEEQQDEAQRRSQQANEAFQRDLQAYNTEKVKLGIPDAEEAEARVFSALNQVQRAVIIKAAKAKGALFVQALAKAPARLAELAAIEDPIELAATIGEMRGKVSMKKRKAPPPEEVANGSATMASSDEQLKRLEAEAAKTGDRTKLIAYKARLKAKK